MNTSNSASLQLLGIANRVAANARDCVSALADSLAGTVPAASACQTMIMADGGGLAVAVRGENGNWKNVLRLGEHSGGMASTLQKHLSQLPRGPVMLRTGTGRAVVSRLPLPAAAQDVLPAVVRNKVESLAPWPLAEALWGYRVAGKTEAGQLLVDVGIVSRKTAFGLLHGLENAGVKIARFEINPDAQAGAGIEIDTHGDDRRQVARRKIATAMSVLAVIAAGAAAFGGYQAFRSYSEASALDANIEQLTQSLRGTGTGGAGSAQLTAANTLYTRKQDTRPTLEVLNTLTKLVPDGIWLTTLDLDGGKITLSGRGNQVPGVIGTLENSDTFKDVNFASATQREPDAAADSFAISAAVEGKEAQP